MHDALESLRGDVDRLRAEKIAATQSGMSDYVVRTIEDEMYAAIMRLAEGAEK